MSVVAQRLLRAKRAIWLLLVAVLSVTAAAGAQAVSALPRPTGYVSDDAGVIDAGSRAQLEELCREVDTKAKAQIAIVTVKNLNNESIDQYATDLEDAWKVGSKATDRGLILLISTGDRKYRIEVGRGLEGVLNDAKVGDIGRTMVPLLKSGQYGQAALGATETIAQDIGADAGVAITMPTPDGPDGPPIYTTPQSGTLPQPAASGTSHHHGARLGWVGPLIFVLFLLFALRGGGGGRGGGGRSGLMWFLLGNVLGGGFGGRGGGGWGGGGFGGGDGGGGGGFGGFGGGGSDGGGASGSF